MDIIVRNCTEADADAVYALSEELGYSQPEMNEARERLETLLQSGHDRVLVAEHNGQVIGWLLKHFMETDLVKPEPEPGFYRSLFHSIWVMSSCVIFSSDRSIAVSDWERG